MTVMTPPPQVGQIVFRGSELVNGQYFGVITEGVTADQFSSTWELLGDAGTLITAAIKGDVGDDGIDAMVLRLQTSIVDDPADLPGDLTNTIADLGKYWMLDELDDDGDIVGTAAFIWFGTTYRKMPLGSPGQPGPCPQITWNIHTIAISDTSQDTRVDITDADTAAPTIDIWLRNVQGPQGFSAPLKTFNDVDPTPPEIGQLFGFSGNYTVDSLPIWGPIFAGDIVPRAFTMPEAAFSNYVGLAQRPNIGSFQLSSCPFDWKPVVFGQLEAFGLSISLSPLMIGAEVRLGDPTTGTLVARGFGNTLSQTTLLPHFSSPSSPSTAVTPTNSLAKVPANHVNPALGTLYVNLFIENALITLYDFKAANAQLFIMQVPV